MSEWVPSRGAVAMLLDAGLQGEETLRIWAEEGLRSKAAKTKCVGLDERDGEAFMIPSDFWQRVKIDPDAHADWGAGLFEATVEIYDEHYASFMSERWRMSGVTFNTNDLAARIELTGHNAGGAGPMMDDGNRGQLPQSAKPNDRKHEDAAHEVAGIVRQQKVKLSEALRTVCENVPQRNRQLKSVERAIRNTYGLMYHLDGTPIKN